MSHTFEDLVRLEQAAQAAHQQYTAPGVDDLDGARQAWIKAAVTVHAAAEGKSRVEVEMAVKKAVRHGEAEG